MKEMSPSMPWVSSSVPHLDPECGEKTYFWDEVDHGIDGSPGAIGKISYV